MLLVVFQQENEVRIHRGSAFPWKGADVDHDVYFARESLQDGLRPQTVSEPFVSVDVEFEFFEFDQI